jgi:hypothetical protein
MRCHQTSEKEGRMAGGALEKVLNESVVGGSDEARAQMAGALRSGATIKVVADLLGVEEDDVWHVVVQDSDVRAAMREGQSNRAERVQRELMDGTAEALQTIRGLMGNEEAAPELRLKAAEAWLDRTKETAKRGGEKGGATNTTNNLLLMSDVDPAFMQRMQSRMLGVRED